MPDAYRSRNAREAITSRLRLRNHDYREPGPYFVPSCVEYRACLFGSIKDSDMTWLDAGTMVDQCWRGIRGRFPSVELDVHVVMPNHMHGILTLQPDHEGNIRVDGPLLSDVIHWFKRQTIQRYSQGVRGWLESV